MKINLNLDKPMQAHIFKANPAHEYYFEEGCYVLELSNSEHYPDLSIVRCRVCSGVCTELHRLHGTVERYVVLSGTGLMEIETLSPEILTAGDIAVIPPGFSQRITNTGTGDLIFLAVCSPRFQAEVYEALS